MANNFGDLVIDAYAAIDNVSRKLVGMIPAVTRNLSAEAAALNQDVVYLTDQSATLADWTPAMTPPTPSDITPGTRKMSMSKARKGDFKYTGEEQRSLVNGDGFPSVQSQQIAARMEAILQEIELDLITEAATNAASAYGTPGTVPFTGGDTEDLAATRKLLIDRGAPGDMQLVINSTTGVKVGKALGWNANRADVANLSDQGVISTPHGVQMRETTAFYEHTAGTAASATTDNAGYAVGATTITLASAGTGTILTGDFITFAGDSNAYRVVTGDADVSDGGTVVIAAPGLLKAIPAAATAITVKATWEANVGFSRFALHLVARPPLIPEGGDGGKNHEIITDPRTGLSFLLSEYGGYGMNSLTVSEVWGYEAVRPAHIGVLLG